MYYEIKFEFQVAARRRAAGNQIRSARLLEAKRQLRGSNSSVARTPRSLPKPGRGLPCTIHKPRVTSHRILIVTPRLEFPATVTKQSPDRISNRYKIAVFPSELPVPARNRREPSPLEFLIANLELESVLNIAKSIKYKFLIANKRGFLVRCGGSRVLVRRNLFVHAGI
jgi:hypothetical protein